MVLDVLPAGELAHLGARVRSSAAAILSICRSSSPARMTVVRSLAAGAAAAFGTGCFFGRRFRKPLPTTNLDERGQSAVTPARRLVRDARRARTSFNQPDVPIGWLLPLRHWRNGNPHHLRSVQPR